MRESLILVRESLIFVSESLILVRESLILVHQFFRLVAWLSWVAIAIIHPKANPKPKNLELHQAL
ncbi:hypothetical protein [Nostoc sp.]|uniref:hypothetical protein n=1 Tax=Nostoc sp. TaxID=1180 RepID=UPI002FFA4789